MLTLVACHQRSDSSRSSVTTNPERSSRPELPRALDESTDEVTDQSELTLAPRALLVRASLDLTGVRPTTAELRALESDPNSLSDRLDALVEDPRFLNRIRYIFAPAFQTLVDGYDPVEALDQPQLSRAIGEEPLNLLAHIVSLDRPFSEIVTAPYTVVDDSLLDIWPLSALDEGTVVTSLEPSEHDSERNSELVVATYTDGRPMSGVLSMNAMWWRHTSTLENANRGRAEALSRALLCEGWLDRPILFPTDVDLTNEEAMRDAISTHPACVSCHASLDPLASFFWGFMNEREDLQSLRSYLPQRELDWREQTGAAPSWFGRRGETLFDLGSYIIEDPRFTRCATRRVYEHLTGRSLDSTELSALDLHHQRFIESGLNVKHLVRSVIQGTAYRNASVSALASSVEPIGVKVISASLLASELRDLTGYSPRRDERSLLHLDAELRSVAGDGGQRGAQEPSTGLALTHLRLAEGAAWHLISGEGLEEVDGEGYGGVIGQLLSEVDLERAPTAEVIEALIAVALSTPRSSDLDTDTDLQAELIELTETLLERAEDISEVWRGLLTAIIADPARLLY